MDVGAQARKDKALKELADFANDDNTKFVSVGTSNLEQCEVVRKWDMILPVVQEFQQELGEVCSILQSQD